MLINAGTPEAWATLDRLVAQGDERLFTAVLSVVGSDWRKSPERAVLLLSGAATRREPRLAAAACRSLRDVQTARSTRDLRALGYCDPLPNTPEWRDSVASLRAVR